MKKYKVFWTRQAADDVEEIIEYIRHDQPDAAERVYKEIRKKCIQLKTQPERYRVVSEFAELGIQHYRQISVAPYRVIFKIAHDGVYVFAVVDGRRDFESFLFRRLMRTPTR